MENGHVATSIKCSPAEKSVKHPVAKASGDARSSRPDGRGPHHRIPERKQLNRCEAFIIARSLWPFR